MLNPHCNFPFIYVLFGVSSELVDFWTPKYVGKEWTDIGENDISFFFFFFNNPINIISKDWFYLIFDHVKLSS